MIESGFMGIVFCQNSFIGGLLMHSRIYGYDFQKFLLSYGYTFERFLQIYGWYFCDLNGETPYLGNSSPPPPGGIKNYDSQAGSKRDHAVSYIQAALTTDYLSLLDLPRN